MCGNMVDIQPATAEIRRGNKTTTTTSPTTTPTPTPTPPTTTTNYRMKI